MEHWFSKLYASIDAMRLDEFAAGLAPDVKLIVGNNPPMMAGRPPRKASGTFSRPSMGSSTTW